MSKEDLKTQFPVGSTWQHKKGDIYVVNGYLTLKVGKSHQHAELDECEVVVYSPINSLNDDYGRFSSDFPSSFTKISNS